MRIIIALSVIAAAAVTFVGCADSGTPTAGASEIVNTHCPIMGGKVNPETTVDWNGKKVAFCCPPCLDDWATMSDDERQAALDKAAEGGDHDSDEDVGHDSADHEDHGDADEDAGSETTADDAASETSDESDTDAASNNTDAASDNTDAASDNTDAAPATDESASGA